MKKLLSIALALVLLLALTVPAGAAETKGAAAKEVGVILNGKALTFPAGAKPEIRGGKTMVPVKFIIEALGGKTEIGSNGDIVCTFAEEKPYSHTKEVKFSGLKDSYFKGGYTFMALGYLAGALGLDLFWDRAAQSAVLVDKYALIAEIDKSFTILNGSLEKLKNDPDKNYKSSAVYDITMDMPATDMSEAVKLAIKMKLDMVSSATAVEMNASMDLSSLAKAIEADGTLGWGDLTQEEIAAIKGVLGNVTMQLRFDLKTMTYYMNVPALGLLSDGAVSAQSWIKLDMNDLMDMAGLSGSMADMMQLAKEEVAPTVGGMLYVFSRGLVESMGSGAAQLYDGALQTGGLLAMFLGDSAADKNGPASTFRFGKAELDKLAGEKVADELFDTFAIELTANGGTMTLNFNVKSKTDSSGEAISLSGKMTMSADKAMLDMTLGMGSMGKAKYVLNMTMKPTDQKPQTLPPAGAKVLDLMELLEGVNIPPVATTMNPAAA